MLKLLGTTFPMVGTFIILSFLDFAHFQWRWLLVVGSVPFDTILTSPWIITCSFGAGKKSDSSIQSSKKVRSRRCETNPQKPSLRRCFGGIKNTDPDLGPSTPTHPEKIPLVNREILAPFIIPPQKKQLDLVWLSRVI